MTKPRNYSDHKLLTNYTTKSEQKLLRLSEFRPQAHKKVSLMPKQYIPYHSPALFDRAEKAAKNLQGVETAILCIATAEAFLHDLSEWLSIAIEHKEHYQKNNKTNSLFQAKNHTLLLSQLNKITDEEINIYRTIKNAEDNKIAIDDKYILIANLIRPGEWKKGCRPLQPFIHLKRIRNDIIHTKGNTLSEKNGKIIGYPKSIDRLILEKVIPKPIAYTNWLNLIDSEKFCSFCIEAVKNLIKSFQSILPNTYMSQKFVEKTCLD